MQVDWLNMLKEVMISSTFVPFNAMKFWYNEYTLLKTSPFLWVFFFMDCQYNNVKYRNIFIHNESAVFIIFDIAGAFDCFPCSCKYESANAV
jgi:hypothetical protein